ncbi:hypothetical protein ANN_00969 [Periplaneta americana]|uniref:Uncharacterized protein n=1 Tax=Periplaneta americana TaxID=6978 RepID=A0ABQ8TV60_PERAM|nr:hypothetical protein ANN_00969 [Periplaneta americana]
MVTTSGVENGSSVSEETEHRHTPDWGRCKAAHTPDWGRYKAAELKENIASSLVEPTSRVCNYRSSEITIKFPKKEILKRTVRRIRRLNLLPEPNSIKEI